MNEQDASTIINLYNISSGIKKRKNSILNHQKTNEKKLLASLFLNQKRSIETE